MSMSHSAPLGPSSHARTTTSPASVWTTTSLVCDLLIQGGPTSEQELRIVLLTQVEAGEYGEALGQWCSQERLERLPAVMRWLVGLLKVPVGRSLGVTSSNELSNILGDGRTQALASLLLEAHKNQQSILDNSKTGDKKYGDVTASTKANKQA
ncbi:MAG: hypothetical protein P8X74_14380 [Reinekea sp.]